MEYNSLEDAELWNRISQGDEDAFSYVYTFYSGGMYKYGYKFTQQIELIEDVVQEVFVHLWKSRSRLSIQKSIKFYLLSSFNINSFDERSVQVQLETGRVRVFHE